MAVNKNKILELRSSTKMTYRQIATECECSHTYVLMTCNHRYSEQYFKAQKQNKSLQNKRYREKVKSSKVVDK